MAERRSYTKTDWQYKGSNTLPIVYNVSDVCQELDITSKQLYQLVMSGKYLPAYFTASGKPVFDRLPDVVEETKIVKRIVV